MSELADETTMTTFCNAELSAEDSAKLPLRFIDVEATICNGAGGICFTRSTSWHIISHTWSRCIQDLSRVIGQKLEAGAGCNYECLFETANFKDQKSYQELVEFLVILRSDGVRHVWFDALCINQTDVEEINREIQQMGSYYKRSLGCYVVQHGIGQGYMLMDSSSNSAQAGEAAANAWFTRDGLENCFLPSRGRLPRWFTRVWTLQEWILPQRTFFILEELDNDLHWAVQTMMFKLRSCPCCKYDYTYSEYLITECKQAGQRLDKFRVALQDLKAQGNCNLNDKSHFRKINQAVIGSNARLYFVDDLAYIFVVRLAIALTMENYRSQLGSQEEAMFMQRLELKSRVTSSNNPDIMDLEMMSMILHDVSRRFCTKEEDRVLSVLKVLGVEGILQVRTGKKLYEQLIHLARSLLTTEKKELLVHLCLVDGWGNDRPGMSWAPTLEVRPRTRSEGIAKLAHGYLNEHTFQSQVEVKDVDSITGALLITTCVLSGHLISNNPYGCEPWNDAFWCPPQSLWKNMELQLDDGRVLLDLCACVTQEVPHVCRLRPTSLSKPRLNWMGEQGHIFLTALGLHDDFASLDRVPIWLVWMGEGYTKTLNIKNMYFLVCIGKDLDISSYTGPFHKIGYVGIPSSLLNPQEMLTTTCTIGGFGDNLRAYFTFANK